MWVSQQLGSSWHKTDSLPVRNSLPLVRRQVLRIGRPRERSVRQRVNKRLRGVLTRLQRHFSERNSDRQNPPPERNPSLPSKRNPLPFGKRQRLPTRISYPQ